MYDFIAGGYDELHGKEQLGKLSAISAELQLPEDASVLDVGCGTGLSSVLGRRVVGIDPSMQMVREASKRINALVGAAEKIPFRDKSFDCVICITAIHNFWDPALAVSEMARVSKKTVVVSVLKKAKAAGQLDSLLREKLHVTMTLDCGHDIIYFCSL
ncbi:class I SAM-dependent methyltransferase [Candidatus Woesearchaeota archaeon]|nr:class I SAM-dependent methyltransferase [Candidatus Woesearchaeota archaeon]